jgi:glycosyltransferase involved in cell wall biosynthesis
VRYSPIEQQIPFYTGADATIRFYKDPWEYRGWTGEKEQVITVAQAMRVRDDALKFRVFEACTSGFPRKLFGFANEDVGHLWGGALSYEELKQVLRQNRVFFYTCTFPAPYTMAFQEAWMTGMPVIAIGRELAGWPWFEVPDLITNGEDGFTSDSYDELRGYVARLLEDYELAKKISKKGREKAISLFAKEPIKQQWKAFFESL